ncbi:MAG: hypothetical protein IKA50_01235 [Clostridia bacterium]|nr:hypothetical protein [Clostridia bacterium]
MKNAKRILSILIACAMLMMVMPMAVSAAGTQDDPIDAKTKWFGYGVDTYLLNPTIAEGSDGVWYTLTAEKDGVLFLEHSYKDVDYTIYIHLNGQTYEGGCVDGEPYNRPIVTAPIKEGDVATIQVATENAAAGTVYASMNVIAGDIDNAIKVKSNGLTLVVGAGKTVYFQDDSLNAIYATKGLLVAGDVADTTFYTVSKNTESGSVVKKAVVDSDNDGVIEAKLGGSLGSAGAPPVKPAWAIENNSAKDQTYTLTIVDTAHECVYDDDADMDCNSCGAVRELAHVHKYDHDFDTVCNTCGEEREVELPLNVAGNSISEDVNGLAWLIEAKVDGMELNNTTAIYDNATVNGYKLITMGAVASNNYAKLGRVPNLDDVDGGSAIDVKAKYIYSVNEEAGTVTYAIRVINIPDEYKDREIDILPYIIFEDEDGVQHTLYGNSDRATYNPLA